MTYTSPYSCPAMIARIIHTAVWIDLLELQLRYDSHNKRALVCFQKYFQLINQEIIIIASRSSIIGQLILTEYTNQRGGCLYNSRTSVAHENKLIRWIRWFHYYDCWLSHTRPLGSADTSYLIQLDLHGLRYRYQIVNAVTHLECVKFG